MNNSLSILLKILELLARLRSITENHAIRLFPSSGMQAVANVLSEAVDYKYVARKTFTLAVETDAKVRNGKTLLRPVTIYYMTTKSKALLRKHSPTFRNDAL